MFFLSAAPCASGSTYVDGMVRIISWNVNGLRTLKPSVKAALDSLDADIICLQETKVSPSDVNLERMALVEGYNSFFSFCKVRTGYSGVATYVRASCSAVAASTGSVGDAGEQRVNVTPIDAGEGFCNAVGGASVCWNMYEPSDDWPAVADAIAQGAEYRDVGHRVPVPAEELSLILSEGRVVVTDHNRFVLFNIYAPAVSVEGRYAFKLAFNRSLELKIRALRSAGREVIVAGDFNIAPRACDRAEPVPDIAAFNASPHRAWFRDVLCEEMGFVDTFRGMHPKAAEAYTCWSEATRARETNFGARIDLIVANESLYREDVRGASILRDVLGSDHCPIGVEVRAEPLIEAALPNSPPPFCSKFLRRFQSKQMSMRSFLVQKDAAPRTGGRKDGLERQQVGKRTSQQLGPASVSQAATRHLTSDSRKRPRPRPDQQLRIGAFFQPAASTSNSLSRSERPATFPSLERVDPPPVAAPARDAECKDVVQETGTSELQKPSSEPLAGGKQTNAQEATREWRKLLSGPPPAPLCRHREPCKLKTVKKTGENKGRTFYSCNRPAGLWPKDPDANCNFFQWARWTAGTTMTRR